MALVTITMTGCNNDKKTMGETTASKTENVESSEMSMEEDKTSKYENITTKEEQTTSNEEISENSEEITSKRENTTTQKEEVTKKEQTTVMKEISTIKKEETTTKKEQTTTKKEQTTTKKEQTTTKQEYTTSISISPFEPVTKIEEETTVLGSPAAGELGSKENPIIVYNYPQGQWYDGSYKYIRTKDINEQPIGGVLLQSSTGRVDGINFYITDLTKCILSTKDIHPEDKHMINTTEGPVYDAVEKAYVQNYYVIIA